MKIILTLADLTEPTDTEGLTGYIHTLQTDIERRQGVGFPGVCLTRGDGYVWVTNAELLLDDEVDDEVVELASGLNGTQRLAIVTALHSVHGEVIPGTTAGALRRRGLVNPGHHEAPRALTELGKKVAKYLDTLARQV